MILSPSRCYIFSRVTYGYFVLGKVLWTVFLIGWNKIRYILGGSKDKQANASHDADAGSKH